jgi:antitoxin (DNA-binding transcriptional repressor) of toxin-antitoxin stability system
MDFLRTASICCSNLDRPPGCHLVSLTVRRSLVFSRQGKNKERGAGLREAIFAFGIKLLNVILYRRSAADGRRDELQSLREQLNGPKQVQRELQNGIGGGVRGQDAFVGVARPCEQGENIAITRHSVPAAMLVPVEEAKAKLTHKEIVQGMRKLRKRVKPGKMTIREMVAEGRRF